MSINKENSSFCPECLGQEVDGLNCWEMLGVVTSWEWDSPELGAKHFEIVASFLIQHPSRYKDEAIERLKLMLQRRLDEGFPVDRIRGVHSELYAGSSSVMSEESDRAIKSREWPITVSYVYAAGPTEAVERAKIWTTCVRENL